MWLKLIIRSYWLVHIGRLVRQLDQSEAALLGDELVASRLVFQKALARPTMSSLMGLRFIHQVTFINL